MICIDRLEPRQHLAANGLDPTFGGGDGVVDARVSTKSYAARKSDLVVDDSGRTVLASLYTSKREIGLSRLNADGTPDFSFGKNSYVTIGIGDADTANDTLQITVDHKGRVLVLLDHMLYRLSVAGKLDRQFDHDGAVLLPVIGNATDMAVDARDRPVIVGSSKGKTGSRATVIRLGEKGALDTGFGGGGAYKTPVPQDDTYNQPGNARGVALKVLPSGKIVGAADIQYPWGQYNNENFNGTSAFRLNADGTLDTSYGQSGSMVVLREATDVLFAYAEFRAILPDGGVITENSTATNDLPEGSHNDPAATHNWSYIDAKGRRKRDGFQLLPSSAPVGIYYTHVNGVAKDGSLLVQVGSVGALYRVTADFKKATLIPSRPGQSYTTLLATNAGRLVLASADATVKAKFSVTAIVL